MEGIKARVKVCPSCYHSTLHQSQIHSFPSFPSSSNLSPPCPQSLFLSNIDYLRRTTQQCESLWSTSTAAPRLSPNLRRLLKQGSLIPRSPPTLPYSPPALSLLSPRSSSSFATIPLLIFHYRTRCGGKVKSFISAIYRKDKLGEADFVLCDAHLNQCQENVSALLHSFPPLSPPFPSLPFPSNTLPSPTLPLPLLSNLVT